MNSTIHEIIGLASRNMRIEQLKRCETFIADRLASLGLTVEDAVAQNYTLFTDMRGEPIDFRQPTR